MICSPSGSGPRVRLRICGDEVLERPRSVWDGGESLSRLALTGGFDAIATMSPDDQRDCGKCVPSGGLFESRVCQA